MDSVYILKVGEYYKIGITKNIRERIRHFQTGNPYKVELIALKECVDAANSEKAMHNQFCHNRRFGEWFELGADELAEAIRILDEVSKERFESKCDASRFMVQTPKPEGSGWRKELIGKGKYWIWRRGYGKKRESKYGGKV